jgi:adenosylcobyric acid synthase
MTDSNPRIARCLFVGGSASDVGKSVIATALCRVLFEEGYRVAPFKAQNMSNNAAVAVGGGEIGRAQAAQAEAAGVEPTVDMNPILLKPEADDRSQLIVAGHAVGTVGGRDYWDGRRRLWPHVTAALGRLRRSYDVVVIEGAGSVAELNLPASDLANMRLARHAGAVAILVGDIERGGIFAQMLGTLELLAPGERSLIRGLVVNKFRGDLSLFRTGRQILEQRSGLPVLGVLPYATRLGVPTEDAQSLRGWPIERGSDRLRVALIAYPHLSNFDDVDPLRDDGVDVAVVRSPDALDAPDLIVLPGSKATISDLSWLKDTGVGSAVARAATIGVPVLGICGGYQMLGTEISDPYGVEGPPRSVTALGLLPVTTVLRWPKVTRRVTGRTASPTWVWDDGEPFEGYEIHVGETTRTEAPTFATIELEGREPDGCVSADGAIIGTYVHGLFARRSFRRHVIQRLAARRGGAVSIPMPAAHSVSTWFRSNFDIGKVIEWLR